MSSNFPLNILTFPYWWYTVGFSLFWKWANRRRHYSLQKTGLLVFARHMKEPLYGDYTKSGIFLSFIIRIFLLGYKLLVFSIQMLILVLLGFCYTFLIPLIIIMIVFQMIG